MGFPTPNVVPFSGTKSLNKCLFKVQFLILAVQAKYQQNPLSKIAQFRQTPVLPEARKSYQQKDI